MAPGRTKTIEEFQEGGDKTDPNIADGGSAREPVDEREVIMEFEGHLVREQFITIIGASMMKLAEKLNHGDEVALEVICKVGKGEIITRQRSRRDGGPEETVINRKLKASNVKLIRATSQML